MTTQYDYYRELVKTRQGMEWNNLLVAEVANSLHSIHDEIAAVRRTTTAAIAMQQELLNRELIQARLEEFVYQAERMVEEFENANGSIDLSTQFYLLTGLLEAIKEQGISTAVMRGRDNKAAFDKVVSRATAHRQMLLAEKEVKKALLWAEEEQRRVAERARQEDEEIARKKQQREASLKEKLDEIRNELQSQEDTRADLKQQIETLSRERKPTNFIEWYRFKFQFDSPLTHGVMWLFYGFVWIPVYWYLTKGNASDADPELNAKLTRQIDDLRARSKQIDGQIERLQNRAMPLVAELGAVLSHEEISRWVGT